MIIMLNNNHTASERQSLINSLEEHNVTIHNVQGQSHEILGLVGETSQISTDSISKFDAVERVERILEPYKQASRSFQSHDTIVDVDGVKVGGEHFMVAAGPCSVEDEDLMVETAIALKARGANMLRGGAFKPRTSPYSFQGLGEEGLRRLRVAKAETGLPIVSELMSADNLDLFVQHVDLIQIGTRNMQNFSLLKELGKINTPILLKRGLTATYEEWLMSAEYIMAGGNTNVILCERGIRTFEQGTRNTLDLQAVPYLKSKTHLPIVIDPSHAAGIRDFVKPMSKAAIVSGANGLVIEAHPNPEKAWSDGQQTISLQDFEQLMAAAQPLLSLEQRVF